MYNEFADAGIKSLGTGRPKRRGLGFMGYLYLAVMVGVITLVTLVSVPSLFTRRCPKCGARNRIEARHCRACGLALPMEDL